MKKQGFLFLFAGALTLLGEVAVDVGMYKITVRSVGEPLPSSSPAPLVVGFR
jgi:hypothetical protein